MPVDRRRPRRPRRPTPGRSAPSSSRRCSRWWSGGLWSDATWPARAAHRRSDRRSPSGALVAGLAIEPGDPRRGSGPAGRGRRHASSSRVYVLIARAYPVEPAPQGLLRAVRSVDRAVARRTRRRRLARGHRDAGVRSSGSSRSSCCRRWCCCSRSCASTRAARRTRSTRAPARRRGVATVGLFAFQDGVLQLTATGESRSPVPGPSSSCWRSCADCCPAVRCASAAACPPAS